MCSYPDPHQQDSELLDRLLELPNSQQVDLAWVRAELWQECNEFRVVPDSLVRGMQANMWGLELQGANTTRRFLVKRIVPKELPPKKSREVWLDFVRSVRTEVQFYEQLRAAPPSVQSLFPTVHHTSASPATLDTAAPLNTQFCLVMEDLVAAGYTQQPCLDTRQAGAVLDCLAVLHASYWGELSPTAPRGGFWLLERRKQFGELAGAGAAWAGLLGRLPELADIHPRVAEAGDLVAKLAGDWDAVVEAGAETRIHGDCKAWNLFLASQPATSPPVLLIDMQWTGRGHPLQDVVYLLTTSLEADCLAHTEQLLERYLARLGAELEARPASLPRPPSVPAYLSRLRGDYDTVWLDYARVILTALWTNLDRNSLESNKHKVGPSMINRSLEHVIYITRRLCSLLF